MAKDIVSGVGVRWAAVVVNGDDGLPTAEFNSGTLQGPTFAGRIKTVSVTDPAPQRFSHYGNDRPYAQDSLPPTEVGSFSFTIADESLTLDALLEGNSVRTINGNKFRGGNSDKRGAEPLVTFFAYRQALDTDPDSSTEGQLRQWHLRIYPSTRISPQTRSFEQGMTDKTYEATPSPASKTPWNEQFDTTNWGQTASEYIDGVTDYEPRFNWGVGNGTLTTFALTHEPQSSSSLTVWVDGTLTTPDSVDTAAPSFTLTTPPTPAQQIFALIETEKPTL